MQYDGKNQDFEIEDLFDKELLDLEIGGRKFDRNLANTEKTYGKNDFSIYVSKNYKEINFSRFYPLLDEIVKIIKDCTNN